MLEVESGDNTQLCTDIIMNVYPNTLVFCFSHDLIVSVSRYVSGYNFHLLANVDIFPQNFLYDWIVVMPTIFLPLSLGNRQYISLKTFLV